MAKKEIFEQIQEKLTISTDELNKIYKDLEQEFISRGSKPTEDMILNRILAYLEPSLRNKATKHSGIFVGISDNFNFNKNVDIVKLDSSTRYAEDKEKAKEDKVVMIINEQVIPLWHYVDGINVQDFQLGRAITDYDYSATSYVLVETDKSYQLKSFNLRGERRAEVLKNFEQMKGKKYTFMASEKDNGTLSGSKYTKFILDEEQPKESFANILVKSVKIFSKDKNGKCIDLKELQEFFNKNVEKVKKGYLYEPVFIKGTTSQVIVSPTRDNNTVKIVDLHYTKDFFAYMPKFLGTPVQGAVNTIYGGILKRQEDKPETPYILNGFMFFETEDVKNIKIPESIKKYMVQEEQGNVQESLQIIEKTKEEDW